MRVSWNWLSEFVDLSSLKEPSALADLLTDRGLEVESIDRLDQGFEKVITAQILERKPHPQADRLSICQVSTGEGSPLEIVCGAQNMKAGDKVALAQIGALLPNGLKIAAGKIRGVVSNGMLCSEEELKLKEKSEGILILPENTPLGRPLTEVLGRNDTIFSLKLTANRGDCLSHYGIAREIGAALHRKVKRPAPVELLEGKSPISVQLTAGEMAPQYGGCYIKNVKMGPSPAWVVQRLESLGSRSINNVVDATNLVLFELGHPIHAFDAKKIKGGKIQVRISKEGESLPLLDGQTIQLTGAEVVIADAERAIALAGIMGGGNSEVDEKTQDLFLECGEFNPVMVRRSSIRHQHRTEGSHRFERGVDSHAVPHVLGRLAGLVIELAGGQVVGSVFDQIPSAKKKPREIRSPLHYFNDFLGFERDAEPLTLSKAQQLLESLDCKVSRDSVEWIIIPPTYRLDLNIKEDFVEEIARSLGYEKIPATIPPLSSSPAFAASSLSRWEALSRTKDSLMRSGLHETINFAFSSEAWLARFGLQSTAKVLNPLSEEHEFLVPSLIPGLVRNAMNNWNHHFGSEPLAIRLFELRPVFSSQGEIKADGEHSTGVQESWKLGMLLTGPRYAEALRSERGEVDFYDLKSVIEVLVVGLGARGIRFQPMHSSRSGGNPLFHPGQSVEVLAGNSVLGYFGLLHPEKSQEFKARTPVWLAELDWDLLLQFSRPAFTGAAFKAWPEFPSIERDFALVVRNDVTVDKICQLALKSGKPLVKAAKVFDIYRGSQVVEGMTSVAVRVIFYDDSRSLQESEAEAASARILESWKKELGAELRG